MRLILIRHARAEDLDSKKKSADALRPLTPDGKRKMKSAAKGLHRLQPGIDVLATSPLKRAMQTAEILVTACAGKLKVIELDLLSGGHPPTALIAWIKDQNPDAATVAIVGHEPDLSRWAGFFVTGKEKSIVTMKKGAACIIDFPHAPAAGMGVLAGLHQSADLRKIGG